MAKSTNPQSKKVGCGIIATLALVGICVFTIPALLIEFAEGRVLTADYVPTAATIYNVNETEERYFPGLLYTFADQAYEKATFFGEEAWPQGNESWHQVKNTIAAAGKREEQLIIYVDPENPEYFSLTGKPIQNFYFYLSVLLAGIMVCGGLMWLVNAGLSRKRWVKIEEY